MSPHHGSRSTRVVLALALTAPFIASAPRADVVDDVRGILRLDWSSQVRTEAAVVDELAALGPGAVPDLFALYVGESLGELIGEDARLDDPRWFTAPSDFGPLFLQALARQPASVVVGHLETRTKDASEEVRLSAVRVLGALGSREGLGLLADLADLFGPLAMRYHSVQDPVADTLQRILGNDPGALLMIEDLLEEQTVEFAGIVVRAVTRSHREGALRILERALGRDPELDARILGAVAEMSVRAPWTVGGDAAEVVRPYLGAKDWRLRQAAASAAGRMGDRESFSRVVLLLEDGNAAVRFAARRALVEMSGTSRFESTDDWLRWLDEQTTWWERNQDRLRAELESETPQVLLRAVRELTERALFRHEATAMLCELLRRPEPGVVATVCGVLAELDSATAVPELVAALDRREVPDGVHSALVAMTGEHLPADHQVWTDYLRGSDRGTQ